MGKQVHSQYFLSWSAQKPAGKQVYLATETPDGKSSTLTDHPLGLT
jgi:hypothetical protein